MAIISLENDLIKAVILHFEWSSFRVLGTCDSIQSLIILNRVEISCFVQVPSTEISKKNVF